MDTALKFLRDRGMALAAHLRHIEMIHFRGRIVRRKNFMIAMTTAARRGAIDAGNAQSAMHAVAVGFERIFDGNVIFLHDGRIGVTTRAGETKLPRIHPRKRIGAAANVVAAVAIAASGRVAGSLAFAVYAFCQLRDGSFMAGAASGGGELFGMGNFLYIRMAGNAIETGMHRVLHVRRLNEKRTCRAGAVGHGKIFIAVAGLAIERVLCRSRCRDSEPDDQEARKSCQNCFVNLFHKFLKHKL